MFDGRWRGGLERGLGPVGSVLRSAGVTADQLTASGLFLAAAAALAIGSGHLGLGLVLLIASALPDLLDGAVARARGGGSVRGAFFDSVADRVTDALVLGGVAWHLADTHGGPVSVLPLAVAAASSLVSYERAKAESLGYRARGGLMERAERVVVLCFGLLLSAVLVPVLWVLLALTVVTAVHRFAMVWRQASPEARAAAGTAEQHLARRRAESRRERWRSWREMAAADPGMVSRWRRRRDRLHLRRRVDRARPRR